MSGEDDQRVKLRRLRADVSQRANRLSDRSLVLTILGISAGLLIPLIALFSVLLNSFLGGTVLLAALAGIAAMLMRARVSH